jgi:hypothetical protein
LEINMDPDLRDFLNRLSEVTAVDAMVDFVVEQPRPARLTKPSEKEGRAHLIKVRAIIRKAKSTRVLSTLANGIRKAYPAIKCKDDVAAVLSGFYDYGNNGFMRSRDKAVIELLDCHRVEDAGAHEFIEKCGGVHQAYLRRIEEKRGRAIGATNKPRRRILRGSRPTIFERDGQELVGIIRVTDADKGQIEFVGFVNLPTGIRPEFVRELALLVKRHGNEVAITGGTAEKGGKMALFNKVAPPKSLASERNSQTPIPATVRR